MAITRAKKEQVLSGLRESFPQAKSIVFVKNKGVDVNSLNKLKKQLFQEKVSLNVAKKTLIQLALKDLQITDLQPAVLEGPIMVALSMQDEVTAAKLLKSFMKENDKLEFTGGIVGGVVYDQKAVTAFASLPGRTELLGQLVGMLKSPLSGLHNALHYNLRGLVQVLSKIEQQKAAA